MKKRIVLSLLSLLAVGFAFSQEKATVDYKSDFTYLVTVNDTSVVKLIGNVFFFHNGAIISCDSAYRYSEQRMEGMGNVIINQRSTHIYGDKIVYNGETNMAQVFSPLIKVVDSTTTMYTYNMLFNTKSQIGEFYGGGTLSQGDNVLESEKGYYQAQTQNVIFQEDVVMTNREYLLKTEELDFNMQTEIATFDTLTNIWKSDGKYLQADRGRYLSKQGVYDFTRNSYLLTETQEGWSDTLTYYNQANEVEMFGNIQIDDTTRNVMAFGDYGHFWNTTRHTLLTKRPSVVMYNPESTADSTFVCADTIFARPILEVNAPASDSLFSDSTLLALGAIDSAMLDADSLSLPDSLMQPDSPALPDSLAVAADTIPELPAAVTVLTEKELRAAEKKEGKARKREMRQKRQEEREFLRKERYLKWLQKKGLPVEIDTIRLDDTTAMDSVLQEKPVPEIKHEPDSSDYIIRAYLNSKIYKSDLQSISDSLIIETVDSTLTSIGKPIAWNELNQITAGRIRTYIQNGAVFRSRFFEKPIIAQKVGANEYNQIQGKTMDALYRDNTIYRLNVNGDSETIFYREEGIKDGPPGRQEIVALITISSENMVVSIDSSRIIRLKWIGKTSTVTYPMNLIPLDLPRTLEGFSWQPEKRPTKQDVFDRTIRPSFRAQAEAIVQPRFVITEQINQRKQQLLQSGTWRDRNEPIGIDPQYFLNKQP